MKKNYRGNILIIPHIKTKYNIFFIKLWISPEIKNSVKNIFTEFFISYFELFLFKASDGETPTYVPM